jgi:hypothetical protein
VSPIWKLLWYPGGVPPTASSSDSKTSSATTTTGENFPLLKQIKNELNKVQFISMIKDNVSVNKSK